MPLGWHCIGAAYHWEHMGRHTIGMTWGSITYFSELGPYQMDQPRGQFHVPDGAIQRGPMGYIVAIADGWAKV